MDYQIVFQHEVVSVRTKHSKQSFCASVYEVDQVGAKIKVTLKTRGGNTFHETLLPTTLSSVQDND